MHFRQGAQDKGLGYTSSLHPLSSRLLWQQYAPPGYAPVALFVTDH